MALKFQRWKLSGELSPNQYDDNSCIITITGLPSGWSWELFLNHGESLDVIALGLDESGTVAQTILKKEQLAFSGLYTIQLRGKKEKITQHTNKLGFTVGDSFSESAHWPEIPDAFNKYVQSVADNLKESLDVSTAVEKYLEQNPVTFTENDPTVPAWAKETNPPTYSASEVGAIPVPSAAKVGQTIVVSAVADTGAPTAWEPADLPTGGGSETWELINSVTTASADDTSVTISLDTNGNAFALKKVYVRAYNFTPQNTYAVLRFNGQKWTQQYKTGSLGSTTPNVNNALRMMWEKIASGFYRFSSSKGVEISSGYVIRAGEINTNGSAQEATEEITQIYFGLGTGGTIGEGAVVELWGVRA